MKRRIIPVLLLCLLLTACGQIDSRKTQNALNATKTAPSTLSTTAPTTTLPTTKPTYATMTVRVSGKERYELMKAAATDDVALEEFVATERHPWLKDRENIVAFLKLLDTLPVFSVENATYVSVNYQRHNDYLYIVYRVSEEAQLHWYRFEYVLDKEKNAAYKETAMREVGTKELEKVCKDKNVTYLKSDVTDPSRDYASYMGFYRLEANGMFVFVTYKNIYTNVFEQKPGEVFAPVRLEKTFDDAVKSVRTVTVQPTPTTRPTTVPTVAPTISTTPKATTPKATVEGGKPTIYWTSRPSISTINPYLQSTQ